MLLSLYPAPYRCSTFVASHSCTDEYLSASGIRNQHICHVVVYHQLPVVTQSRTYGNASSTTLYQRTLFINARSNVNVFFR